MRSFLLECCSLGVGSGLARPVRVPESMAARAARELGEEQQRDELSTELDLSL